MSKRKAIFQGGRIWDNYEGKYRDRTVWDSTIDFLSARKLFESYIAPHCNSGGYEKEEMWLCLPPPSNLVMIDNQGDDTFISLLELYVQDRTVARAIFNLAFDAAKGKFP